MNEINGKLTRAELTRKRTIQRNRNFDMMVKRDLVMPEQLDGFLDSPAIKLANEDSFLNVLKPFFVFSYSEAEKAVYGILWLNKHCLYRSKMSSENDANLNLILLQQVYNKHWCRQNTQLFNITSPSSYVSKIRSVWMTPACWLALINFELNCCFTTWIFFKLYLTYIKFGAISCTVMRDILHQGIGAISCKVANDVRYFYKSMYRPTTSLHVYNIRQNISRRTSFEPYRPLPSKTSSRAWDSVRINEILSTCMCQPSQLNNLTLHLLPFIIPSYAPAAVSYFLHNYRAQ